MFIKIKGNQIINLDNVDSIWVFNDGGGYEVKFIKYTGYSRGKDYCVIGSALFDTKEEMEKFVDKRLKPLTYNPLGNIEFYLEEISKNVGM